jgi:hypothetical protein
VDLVDSNTEALWLDEMTLSHLEFGKVFLHESCWQSSYLSTRKISEHLDH